ncbi:MAG: hypothetical protein DWQ07_02580 [Chloroflexi bacterium]|nr:MAG: hypothetical protein DWQ07_02580 [Chloroflexota bacterium]MBL1193615.1 hypothetical protein [Chloroflexota bacterium]NOH10907.1 hypothetical protein [Chloroflexota bacterium]
MNQKNMLWFGGGAVAMVVVCCVGFLFLSALGNAGDPANNNPPVQVGQANEPESTQAPVEVEQVSEPEPSPTQIPTFVPTVTAFPTPPPPAEVPAAPPADTQSQNLVSYANEIAPILEAILEIAKRDGEILQASEDNDSVLCDGRLSADNLAMQAHLIQVDGITPPSNGTQIHDQLVSSGDAWEEAMENVELFCDTGNGLYKIPAALKFWESAALFQDAANRFWLLLISEGLEAYVNR